MASTRRTDPAPVDARSHVVAVPGSRDAAPTFVGVQAVPRVPAALAGYDAWYLLPAALAVAGLGALAALTLARRTRALNRS